MSLSQTLRGAAARALGKSAHVEQIVAMSPRVFRVRLSSRLAANEIPPGAKIKLHVGHGEMRSYTPVVPEGADGTMDVVVYAHAEGAACRWVRQLTVGDDVAFIGPSTSVRGPDGPLPWACIYGDETAIGLAEALLGALPAGTPVVGALETGAEDAAALTDSRLDAVSRGQAHGDALVAHLKQLDLPPGDGVVWLSGEASAVLRLRQALLDRGVVREQLRIKPYWSLQGKAHRKKLERTVLRS